MVLVQLTGRRTPDALTSAASSFAKLHLSDTLRRALLLAGYRSPSRFQERAIPKAREGTDLIVEAKSGSEKTLVFALACVERVNALSAFPQVLVISHTREIAQDNAKEIEKIAKNLPYSNFNCGVFTGGVTAREDRRQLRHPCQVVVGTPGRLCWLVQKNELNLEHVRLVVFDDADQLYSQQKKSVQFLLRALPAAPQSLAFSASYSKETLTEIEQGMIYPQHLFEDSARLPINPKHCYIMVKAQGEAKVETAFKILSSVSFHQAVIFCRDLIKAESLMALLNGAGYPAALTDQDQSFLSESRVVISTESIVKGVDLERVNFICNLDLDLETVCHSLRGMHGCGICVSLLTPDEKDRLQEIIEEHHLTELPEEIPTDWIKDLSDQENSHKVMEASEAVHSLPITSDWTNTKSEFVSLKDTKHLFWSQWDHSRSSSREGHLRVPAVSEMSHETGSSSTRRVNYIRLSSRMSRSTSASSVVYSEEGECECLDGDVDPMDWLGESPVDSEIQSLAAPLPAPALPPRIESLEDFKAVRDQYEKWRRDYSTWHKQYAAWYNTVQSSPPPPPPLSIHPQE